MKLGLLSDTHGRGDLVEGVVEFFAEEDVDEIIHAGDVTRVTHIETLFELDVPTHLVYGNCDYNQESFQQASKNSPLVLHGTADLIEANGSRLGVTHGHFDRLFDELRDQDPDYIVHGHTHERRDEGQGGIRYVNPGSVKPANSSAAVLDTESDELTFRDIG
jgi:putative phosphoesterase